MPTPSPNRSSGPNPPTTILAAVKRPKREASLTFDCMVTLMGTKILLTAFLAVMFSIIPIIWFTYLPLHDYPNHLATIQIRTTLSSNPYLKQFYKVHWLFTPYLGLDLLITPLMYFVSVEMAGRIVIVLTFVMICVGTILLNRELNPNNWGGLSLFAGIFLYNGAFNWGFINYIIGIAFAIWAFWIWVRYRTKAKGISIISFTVLGGIVWLMHLYAFAIYGVCVAGYECSVFLEKLKIERQLRMSLLRIPFNAVVSLLVPLLATVGFSPVSSNHGQTVWGRTWGPPTFWNSIVKWKGEGLISPIYFHYFFEKPLLLLILAILVWALSTRTIIVNWRMVIPLAAFGVIFMILPFELWGAAFADYRLPSGVAFFGWASLGWGETSVARIAAVRLLLSVCLIVRVGSVLSAWQPRQAIIGEYETALQSAPPGSRLLVIVGDSGYDLEHVPVLAAAKRGIFVPYTFTDNGVLTRGIQLLKLTPDYADYWRDISDSSSIRDIKRFDYLLEIAKPQVKIPIGISLNEVGSGQSFTLYRIDQNIRK
jgi:hypothetical protein